MYLCAHFPVCEPGTVDFKYLPPYDIPYQNLTEVSLPVCKQACIDDQQCDGLIHEGATLTCKLLQGVDKDTPADYVFGVYITFCGMKANLIFNGQLCLGCLFHLQVYEMETCRM